MAKQEMSLTEKIRARLNENSGKEIVKVFAEGEESFLQVMLNPGFH